MGTYCTELRCPALATSDVWGLLSACGPDGKLLGSLGRLLSRSFSMIMSIRDRISRVKKRKEWRDWDVEGCMKTFSLVVRTRA